MCTYIYQNQKKNFRNRCDYVVAHDDNYDHETVFSLFDTYVASILIYCSEIQGFHTAANLEKDHLYFLKCIYKLKMSAVNNIIYSGSGILPFSNERQYRIVKYWLKILSTEHFILKNCFEEMFKRGTNDTEGTVFKRRCLIKNDIQLVL